MAGGAGPEAVGEGLSVLLDEDPGSLDEPGSCEVVGQPPTRVLIWFLVIVGGAAAQLLERLVVDLDSEVSTPDMYTGFITGQITAPVPGNIDGGRSKTVEVK
ncbi:hypothetical protein [Streptomyces phaeochromogenes]